jgi:hypothetical protein
MKSYDHTQWEKLTMEKTQIASEHEYLATKILN